MGDLTTPTGISNMPQMPQTTASAQQSQNTTAAFGQVLASVAAAGVNSVTSGLGGGVAGNLVNGLFGAATGTSSTSANPSFDQQMAQEQAMATELMTEQMQMNQVSQEYTARSNVQQGGHDAEMSVIRNIKS